jgi:UPF0755 protein
VYPDLPKKKLFITISTAIVVLGIVWNILILPGPEFPSGAYFLVRKGESLSVIALELERKNFIRSQFVFKSIVRTILLSGNDAVAGYYLFEKPISTLEVARRIVKGDFKTHPIRVTIPEGATIFQISNILKKYLPLFDEKVFADLAKEGYIFPDTYHFNPDTTAEDVIRATRNTFDKKIESLRYEIAASKKSLDDIIKMASILETEANVLEDRRIISGILWKRLDIDMPLQVDVTFRYINGKNSYELSTDDLAIDSPYNTYKYTGLPPTPIGNPSVEAIEAALFPTDTKYLYFLSDRSNNTYYAETFDGHVINKKKYLNVR